MLAANEAVAETLRDQRAALPPPHPPVAQPAEAPGPDGVRPELGYKTDSLQSRFELQKLLDAVHRPARAACRPFRRAAVAAAGHLQPEGGRPLRPGQRLLLPLHLAHPPLSRPDGPSPAGRRSSPAASRATIYDELVVLGQHCSDREQRAEAAERDLTKLKLLAYLSDRIGEEMDAVVTGVESYGLFVARHQAAGRRAGPRRRPGRRLLPLRPRHAHAGRPPPRQQLPAGRPAAGGRGPRRPLPPRTGFPGGGGGQAETGRGKREAATRAAK